MDQRGILRNKMLAREEVVEARVIRGEPVIKQYGPGRVDEKPKDALDNKALLGEKISLIETINNKLTIIRKDFIAKPLYIGA